MSPQQAAEAAGRRWAARALVAGGCLALALASTWPLGRQLASALPQGTDRAPTVPLFQAWSLWWTADRVGAGFERFWDAPIFFPTPGAFLFSDPVLLAGIASAPVHWLGGPPALAHNLFLLAALVANGLVGFGLLRGVGLDRLPAAAGGAMLLLLPYVHHELGVLMLVPLAGLLATLWSLVRLARRPTPASGLALGVSVAATYLLCGQYAIFVALTIAPAAPWLLRRGLPLARAAVALAVAAAACAALVAPLALRQVEVMDRHDFDRGPAAALRGASHPSAWLATPWPQLVPLPGVGPVEEPWMQAHFPGTLKLSLALVGLVWGLRRRRLRGFTALVATAALLAALLSALPRLEAGGVFAGVASLPGLAQMRSWWRFIAVAQLGVALLAAVGLQALSALGRSHAAPPRGVGVAAAVLGLAAAAELWPPPQRLAPVPDPVRWAAFAAAIRQHRPPDRPVLYLPLPASAGVADFAETARWMYLTPLHGRPMVNGYSGFFPPSYRVLAGALRACPDRGSYLQMGGVGLDFVVTSGAWLRANPECAPPPDAWERVFRLEDLDVEGWRALDQPS